MCIYLYILCYVYTQTYINIHNCSFTFLKQNHIIYTVSQFFFSFNNIWLEVAWNPYQISSEGKGSHYALSLKLNTGERPVSMLQRESRKSKPKVWNKMEGETDQRRDSARSEWGEHEMKNLWSSVASSLWWRLTRETVMDGSCSPKAASSEPHVLALTPCYSPFHIESGLARTPIELWNSEEVRQCWF